MDSYTIQLAREYIETVDNIRSGRFSADDIRTLDSERQYLHNELLRLTGLDRSVDMYQYAVRLLHVARGSNLQ